MAPYSRAAAGAFFIAAALCASGRDALATGTNATGTNAMPRRREPCRVAVVGAGYGGAYFAWRLCVDSATYACSEVCVFEANERVGGRGYTTVTEGTDALPLDMGPYCFRTMGAPTSTGAEASPAPGPLPP